MFYFIKGLFSFVFGQRKSLGLKFNCYSLWGSWMGLDPFHILVLLEWHPFPPPSPYSWLFINLLPNAPIINSLMYVYMCVCVCICVYWSSYQSIKSSINVFFSFCKKDFVVFSSQKNWGEFWMIFFFNCKFDWNF